MNATKDGFKDRQLHMEDYLQMVSAEQREYAEVSVYQRIVENNHIITDFWTDNLMELILRKENLNKAYKKVKSNKGKGGRDGMQVDGLLPYLKENQSEIIRQVREGKYKPNPVRRVEIPKEEKGRVRDLGIPTVVDRLIQQAIAQEVTPLFGAQFSEHSYGFRPGRSQYDALKACKRNVDEGYVYVVSMDLEKFFDTVNHSKLIEVLSRTIKDGRVVSLIHKYLNAGVMQNGYFEKTEEWLRRRIRAVYWKQWKKIKTRYRNLRSLKLEEWQVHELSNSRKGYWRTAQMLSVALTNKQIARLGYISMSDYYLKICEN